MNYNAEIEFEGKKFKMFFGLKTFFKVGNDVGCPTVESLSKRLTLMGEEVQKGSVTFDSIELIWKIIYYSIVSVPGQENIITENEVSCFPMSIINEFSEKLIKVVSSNFGQNLN